MKITLIEPTWNGEVHCPANLGALRMLKVAYPGAAITLVAGERHVDELSRIGAADVQGCCARLAITPACDADTMPRDLLATWQRLRGAPRQALDDADLVFIASASATILSLAAWLPGRAGRARPWPCCTATPVKCRGGVRATRCGARSTCTPACAASWPVGAV